MNDIEEIRQKKMIEMQRRMEEQRIKNVLNQILSPRAYQRLCFVKQSHPELAERVEFAIVQYAQTNTGLKINEEQLKQILMEISSTTRKDFRIRRK